MVLGSSPVAVTLPSEGEISFSFFHTTLVDATTHTHFVFVLLPLLFASRGVGRWLETLNVKLTKLILQIGCSSYRLVSWRKSAQIPKAFYQYRKTEKQK